VLQRDRVHAFLQEPPIDILSSSVQAVQSRRATLNKTVNRIMNQYHHTNGRSGPG